MNLQQHSQPKGIVGGIKQSIAHYAAPGPRTKTRQWRYGNQKLFDGQEICGMEDRQSPILGCIEVFRS